MTRKTTGTSLVSYYANKNLGLSTLETVQVNMLPTSTVYNPSNYTSDNVASQAHVEPQRRRSFRWEELGIELFDLEGSIDGV